MPKKSVFSIILDFLLLYFCAVVLLEDESWLFVTYEGLIPVYQIDVFSIRCVWLDEDLMMIKKLEIPFVLFLVIVVLILGNLMLLCHACYSKYHCTYMFWENLAYVFTRPWSKSLKSLLIWLCLWYILFCWGSIKGSLKAAKLMELWLPYFLLVYIDIFVILLNIKCIV